MRIAAWLLLCVGVAAGCAKHLPPDMEPDEIHVYETKDGWQNDLRRYQGPGEPVLLVHGMGANHYNWDYREEVSLAHHLADRGWDVWVVELRGDPGSHHEDRKARGRFTFDDHALKDMPAAAKTVLDLTDHEQVYWVGHSMGGMLLYTALTLYPDQVAAGVAIGSPATLKTLAPLHRRVRGLGFAVSGRGRIPARALSRLTLPLGRWNPTYARLANRDNLDWPVTNGLARHALIDLPRPMLQQAVHWLRTEQFVRADGETPWMEPSDVPVLVMGASIDQVVPPDNVEAACQVYTNCTYVHLGVDGGFSTEYGHVDPVVGKTAADEVYPLVWRFLEEAREEQP